MAPAVTRRDQAETELIDEYCRWLIQMEEDESTHLLGLFEQSQRELDEQHQHIESLRAEHERMAAQLNQVLNSRTWRLRTNSPA